MPLLKNKLISVFGYLIPIPLIIQVLYWCTFLVKDLFYIGPIHFTFLLPFLKKLNSHYATFVILTSVSIIGYYLVLSHGIIKASVVAALLGFVGAWTYEVFWATYYGITHNWTFNRIIDIQGFVILFAIVSGLYIINHFWKVFTLNKIFVSLLVLEIILYSVATLLNLNWEEADIPTNLPFLWLATKLVGYGMWVALVKK